MKLPILLSAAALTISGLALLTNLNSSPEGARVEPTVKNDTGLNQVRDEIAALRGELNDLSGRLEVLASRPVAPSRIPAGDLVEQSDIDALRAELAEAKGAAATAKLDTQMPEYQQQLGLTNAQTDGLRGVIEARNERVAEMMRLWESGDRAAAGELKGNEAETYQAELQGVLNQQQVEQFNAMGGGRRGGK